MGFPGLNKGSPILEFDPTPKAILEPGRFLHRIGCLDKAVLCFFQEVLKDLVESQLAKRIFAHKSEIGETMEMMEALKPGTSAVGSIERPCAKRSSGW